MKFVIGIDLGTSAVKIILVDQSGNVVQEISKSYPLIHEKSGYSEQDPEQWVEKTREGLAELVNAFPGDVTNIEGISFSGQMHGLVLLDENNEVLRNAILWNDVRTTQQCEDIYKIVGRERLLEITKNPALEGFTLPKILWVQEHEPSIFEKSSVFMLPKDYLRFRLSGKIHSEYSDAAGTLLLNVSQKEWSKEICDLFSIKYELCPPLIESFECVGTITEQFASETGLSPSTRVFAGGADNACGAIGSGILTEGATLCSVGTSGVVLSYEERNDRNFQGKVHYFNHGKKDAFYTMGVTLSAGYSLSWFKKVFAEEDSFETLLDGIEQIPVGANGLLFTPYLVGERTPYADPTIRASFIGMDGSHTKKDFARAVIEGVTFSLYETIKIFRENGKRIQSIISIGGGAKNETWLQIQADIFNAKIVKLKSEQGPGIGAAILAGYGCGWSSSLEELTELFVEPANVYEPIYENVKKYEDLFEIYQSVYQQTKELNGRLSFFRR